MSDNRALFVEEAIIGAVKKILFERVNEIFSNWEIVVPIIEFGKYSCGSVIVPVISLSSCERSEKERIIRLDAYSMSIIFILPETPDTELHCYAYAAAVCKAFGENPTLGGIVDRAAVSGKKYNPPKKATGGNEWEVIITLRITVEETGK